MNIVFREIEIYLRGSVCLSFVSPLWLSCIDAWISDTLLIIRLNDALLINSFKVMLIMRRTVPNHNLARVFVWHDYTCDWQSASVSIWVVWSKLFLYHSRMLSLSYLICSFRHWHDFGWLIQILKTRWMLPPSFFQRICNRNSLALSTDFLLDVRACAYFCVSEINGGFVQFDGFE